MCPIRSTRPYALGRWDGWDTSFCIHLYITRVDGNVYNVTKP